MRMPRALALAALLGGVPLGADAIAQGAPSDIPQAGVGLAESIAAVTDEYDAARKAFSAAYAQAADDDARQALFAESYPRASEYGSRLWTAIDGHEGDPDALKALAWIVQNDDATRARALDVLLAHHLGSPELGDVLLSLVYERSDAGEAFLRAVIGRADDRTLVGKGLYALGTRLHTAALWGSDDAEQKARLDAEAEPLLERAATDYADVPTRRATLGELAGRTLFELRNLAVGRTAPDIVGDGVDGKTLKLSEHRGKVVVIDFWGVLVRPLPEMLPHERSLVDELKDEPFVLLGVNSDGDAEALKKIMQKESITWPQWVDGSTSGPIASAWNVSGWPTIYVLDAQGVIRDRDVRGDELSDAVHALLDELHGREAASGDG